MFQVFMALLFMFITQSFSIFVNIIDDKQISCHGHY